MHITGFRSNLIEPEQSTTPSRGARFNIEPHNGHRKVANLMIVDHQKKFPDFNTRTRSAIVPGEAIDPQALLNLINDYRTELKAEESFRRLLLDALSYWACDKECHFTFQKNKFQELTSRTLEFAKRADQKLTKQDLNALDDFEMTDVERTFSIGLLLKEILQEGKPITRLDFDQYTLAMMVTMLKETRAENDDDRADLQRVSEFKKQLANCFDPSTGLLSLDCFAARLLSIYNRFIPRKPEALDLLMESLTTYVTGDASLYRKVFPSGFRNNLDDEDPDKAQSFREQVLIPLKAEDSKHIGIDPSDEDKVFALAIIIEDWLKTESQYIEDDLLEVALDRYSTGKMINQLMAIPTALPEFISNKSEIKPELFLDFLAKKASLLKTNPELQKDFIQHFLTYIYGNPAQTFIPEPTFDTKKFDIAYKEVDQFEEMFWESKIEQYKQSMSRLGKYMVLQNSLINFLKPDFSETQVDSQDLLERIIALRKIPTHQW